MESIEQMIKRLCPKGVEWKKISEICMNCDSKRKPVTSGKRIAGKYPYYGASGIVDYVEDYIFDGDYLLVSEDGANLLARRTPIAFSISGKNWVNNHAHVLQFDNYIERKYIEYYLNMIDLRKYISGGAQPKLSQQSLNNIFVPVPPLEIQSRIVEVLDKMTTLTAELEAELKAELEARKQQYEYYRSKLLTFNEIGGGNRQVAWKKISEIGTIYRGIAYSKKDFTDTGTPCIHYGQIYTRYGTFANKTFTCVSKDLAKGKRLAKKGDLVMAVTSENMEDVGKCLAWLGEDEILVSNHACFIRHSLNPKYLAYFLQTSYFFKYKKKISKGVKVIDLDLNMFGDMIIPVPSMQEQQRIVSILDRFEALTTDLQSGLPAEIEARRQQYDYYRNKLLTFEAV
ncbi:MAG: restriction endonuclease subunit S [Bacteroidales bacterium]|nr:restriction endonuclease subunit S [Bacteroidales bacterium]